MTARAGIRPLRLVDVVARLERFGLLTPAPAAAAPPADVELRGVSDDSRAVEPGDLFCAWAGTAADSHAYVPAAAQAGAAAALVERAVTGAGLPQVMVRDGRRAAAGAAAALYGDPQDELLITGVTGTNGKTTTVWILRHVLGTQRPTASLGTLGVILEDGSPLAGTESLTTPGPVELARTLRMLVERGVEALAMEVSSHALAQGRVHALRFAAAVFTNLTRDHLDFHGDVEAYRAAKLSLVTFVRSDGWVVWNADDPAWHGIDANAPNALSFGTAEDAEVRAVNIELDGAGARFALTTAAGATPTSIPLPGSFNVQNALGAAAAAIAVGFTPDEAAAALATVPQVAGRLELIANAPCPVLRDYAHTPDALERVLRALRPLASGRLILVFGAGGDRDRGKRPLMGAVAEAGADVPIVTSDNPRTEDPDAIIDDITAGMTAGRHVRITDRRAAIAEALRSATRDDIVLLAGKGHETYQVIGAEKTEFDERAIVRELTDGAGVHT
jgi:UDP-N-acetylmuramoyl-L-alanyl-D-glutamate--2,6-diaminopimelate ligase